MQSVEPVLACGKVICRHVLQSLLSWRMVVSVHAGLDFDLGKCSWLLLERWPKYQVSSYLFKLNWFSLVTNVNQANCYKGRRVPNRIHVLENPCSLELQNSSAWRCEFLGLLSYLETGPQWTCTDFPRLAGVRVPVPTAFWQKDGAWCALYTEEWTRTKMIFSSDVFHTQTTHRIPVTQQQRNKSGVLDFAMKLCPKLNMAWGGGGSSRITYF